MSTASAPLQTAAPATGLPPVPLLAVALLAVAANMRVAMSSVPPLRDTVVADLHLSNASMGALTTLPVLCMGLFAPAAQQLARRYGAAAGVQLAVLTVFVGVGARLWGGSPWVLYAGTFLAGVGIAVGGTLLPGLVKALFPPHRTGLVTGLYMLAMMGGAAVSSALSVPLAALLGSWQGSLASWSLLAAVGALAWVPVTVGSARHRAANPVVDSGHGLPWRHRTAWLVAAFMALQSWLFYSCLAWVAPSFQDHGWDATTTGYLLSVFSGVQVCSGLLGPLLADRIRDRRVLLLSASVFGAAGLLGLLVAPEAAPWVWVALLGMGQGPAFSLGMVLLIDYSRTPQGSGRLAAMVLFVSYTVAAWGPTTMGAVRDATGGFRWVWAMLFVLAVVQTLLVTSFRRTLPQTP
jgi:CP family cyanate transporter-like MFS transporter